jgi:aspartate ammonia-lyase
MTQSTGLTYRIERDSMGERQIPESAYYGIQTLRAMENFPISGTKPLPTYVDACVLIKKQLRSQMVNSAVFPKTLAVLLSKQLMKSSRATSGISLS